MPSPDTYVVYKCAYAMHQVNLGHVSDYSLLCVMYNGRREIPKVAGHYPRLQAGRG